MRNKCIVIVAIALLSLQFAIAGVGESGFSFLKLGISGQAVAMSDATSAHVSGAAATFYNPAGLVQAEHPDDGTQLLFMHKEWIQDARTQFLGVRSSLGDESAFGISLNNTTVSEIEIRRRPGAAEGTFTARNFSLGVSYAQMFGENISGGVTAKFLYEKLLVDEASGFAFDIGTQIVTPIEGLAVGATIANIGSVSKLRTESSTLPTYARVGPAYHMEIPDISSAVLIAADLIHIFPDGVSLVGVGGEISFQQMIAVRTGYQLGSEARGFSAGVGVTYGMFTLDYAFAPLSNDLGSTHTIALSLNL
ncbi:MAG: PorV/PorQ family protein [Bacteroidota bacterium]